ADVMALLGGRAPVDRDDGRGDDERFAGTLLEPGAEPPGSAQPDAAALTAAPGVSGNAVPAAFTVFEVGLDAWLEHRERERARGADTPLLAYFAAAAAAALPGLGALAAEPRRLDILRAGERETVRTRLEPSDLASLATLAGALRRAPAADPGAGGAAGLGLHDYGAAGCVLAAPLPMEPGN